MADINAEVAAQQHDTAKPAKASHARGETDEDHDHVADYMNARRRNATAAAAVRASVAAQGYGSDEEVYATAAAVDAASGYVDEAALEAAATTMQLLPPVDHAAIEYKEFCKEFYEVWVVCWLHPNAYSASSTRFNPPRSHWNLLP